MDPSKLIVGGVLAYILWTLFSAHVQPPPSLDGKKPIEYGSTVHHWNRTSADAVGTLDILDSKGGVLRSYAAGPDGVLHEGDDPNPSGLHARYTPHDYAIDFAGFSSFDAGAFAALPQRGDLALGVRLSPGRLLFNAISPDVTITHDSVGLGLSAYPPSRFVGYPWAHFGLGCWYQHPFRDGGADGLAVGLSTSFRQ